MTQRAQRLYSEPRGGIDDTSVNSTLADDGSDIEDDAGIESFEDGENYPLDDDTGTDDETDD